MPKCQIASLQVKLLPSWSYSPILKLLLSACSGWKCSNFLLKISYVDFLIKLREIQLVISILSLLQTVIFALRLKAIRHRRLKVVLKGFRTTLTLFTTAY